MATLYLDRRHLRISIENRRLRMDVAEQKPQFVPLHLLKRLVIAGKTEFNSSTLAALGGAGVAVICISARDSSVLAQLVGAPHRDASLRLKQYEYRLDPVWSMRLARETVQAKLMSQQVRLQALDAKTSAAGLARRRTLERIDTALGKLDSVDSIEQLMGFEGGVQPAWFDLLKALLPDALGFHGRNRRPPRDPANAVLSLAYTMLHFEAVRVSYMRGFDPYIGFLHVVEHGRESLACDLIEAHRPRIDFWVVDLFRTRYLRDDHFSRNREACLLGKEGRSRFYAAWESFALPLRRLLRLQVNTLARQLLDHE